MNILRKLNGTLLLMLSGAILTTTIPACKKSDSGGGNPQTPPVTTNNTYAKVSGDPSLSVLKGLIDKGGLKTTLENSGKNFTILAPVDAVLNNYEYTAAKLDPADCDLIVAYHTIDGKYTFADLAKDVPPGKNQKYFTITTPNNQQDSVFITKFGGNAYVNGIDIDATKKDISTDNGVIHKLNGQYGFLFPPFKNAYDYINTPTKPTASATTKEFGLDSLAKAINIAIKTLPILETVLKNSVVTVIAPTNKAFQDFFNAQSSIKKVDDFPIAKLLELLSDHVITDRCFIPNLLYASSSLGGSTGIKTYSYQTLKLSSSPLALYINPDKAAALNLNYADNTVLNGAVHKLSGFLLR